ncbi:XRE family transcriptional regulator [Oceanicola sp. 22II-s10i]|uniref:helix-turn-helix domain-containing protein n=1 Tax=Oceanicola sp. 22II-s10i TaxID=1317116 RepID=UPI000B522D8D|nr:helix-turn-helix transcriptional regulator [Oceanicola sp. 22II-s10i]OWU82349.1 XRE family transcriptional regulator [Oceanicola sp. 22II-s10i]
MTQHAPIGALIRGWRQSRHLSQLALSAEAEVSQKHLSHIESGRAAPSRDMVLRLAEHLEVPLRDRNALLVSAGFAPVYRDRPLDAPDMAVALAAVKTVIDAHAPFPALAFDRTWTMVMANDAVPILLDGVDPALLEPPVNVVRLALHPKGLAARLVNLGEVRAHLLERLKRQWRQTRDPAIRALIDEAAGYPLGDPGHATPGAIALPFRLRTGQGELSFITTTTVFGTATEVSLSELAVEAFLPADPATAAALRA